MSKLEQPSAGQLQPSPIILKHQDFDHRNKRQTRFHGFEKAAKNVLKYK